MDKIILLILFGYSLPSFANFGNFAFFKSSTAAITCTGGWLDSNNFCWIKSGTAASCDTACSGLGGCNLLATRDKVGSAGTNAACQTVMDGLAMAGSGLPSSIAVAVGCAASGVTRRRGSTATTCAATSAGYIRACACAQTGTSCFVGGANVAHGECITVYQGNATCAVTCAEKQESSCCANGAMDNGTQTSCTEWGGVPC